MIHTNRCKHCGKTKEEHLCYDPKNGILGNGPIFCGEPNETFEDSGLAALDAHKEELYETLKSIIDTYKTEHAGFAIQSAIDAGESILNQIEKE